MKVRKLVSTILTFGMILILFVSLPTYVTPTYAAENALEAKLNVNSQSVVKGKTFYLRVYNLKANQSVTFSSSKNSIATVDSTGKVTAVSVGTAVITAKVYDNGKLSKTLTCNITVGPPAIAIMISRLELNLTVGEKAKLSYIIFPLNTAEVPTFSSNDESVASVSAGGKVTAETAGTTTVFCQIADGKFAKCKVTVTEPEQEDTEITEETKTDAEAPVSDEKEVSNDTETSTVSEQTSESVNNVLEDNVPEDDEDTESKEVQNPFTSLFESLFKKN